jgi:protein TonB
MPAQAERFGSVRPRERATALAFAAVVQAALGLALLSGFRVDFQRSRDIVERLIEIGLPVVRVQPVKRAPKVAEAAPKAPLAPTGGSPGPVPAHVSPSVTPVVAIQPSAPPSGGGTGSGPTIGAGSGGGAGGRGSGGDEGDGTNLVQIAGEILPRDYPRHLGDAGIGGTVTGVFTVEVNGRISNCRVTRSSGVPELDALTCRLMEKRFRFRPASDRLGRPVRDEVEWDHEWIPHGGY